MVSIVADDLDGVPVVHLLGEFEPRDTQAFRRYVFDLADQLPESRLIVDLAGLKHTCSGALRVLVLVQRKLSILEGKLVVSGVNGLVREFVDLTHVDQLLEIHGVWGDGSPFALSRVADAGSLEWRGLCVKITAGNSTSTGYGKLRSGFGA